MMTIFWPKKLNYFSSLKKKERDDQETPYEVEKITKYNCSMYFDALKKKHFFDKIENV